MKKQFLVALAILLFAVPALADPTLVWEFTQTENLATGFKVYSQEDVAGATVYSQIISDVSSRSFPIDETRYRPGGTYNFWLTAFNSAGEGPASNTAPYTREAFVPTENPPPTIYNINIPSGSPVSINIER